MGVDSKFLNFCISNFNCCVLWCWQLYVCMYVYMKVTIYWLKNWYFCAYGTVSPRSLSSFTWDMGLKCNHLNHTVSLVSYRVPLIRDGLLNVGQIDLTQWQSPQPLHGMKILEVGCGGGILTEVRDWGTEMLLYAGTRVCIHLFRMEIFYCWF